MHLLRLLIRTLNLLLFAAFGTAAALAAPGDWARASYTLVSQDLSAQPVNVTNTARAPPTNNVKLVSTGKALAQTCNLRAFDCADEQWASLNFGADLDAPNTAAVRGLDEIPTSLATPSSVRADFDDFIKGTNPNRPVSVATAEVTVDGQTQRFVSVSGNNWKADAPDTVIINGQSYTVVRTDSGSVSPSSTTPNTNHAEQKLFSHIQDNYSGQNARVNIAVENTSASNPGMCNGCVETSQNFAAGNPSFEINIFGGSTRANP